MEIKQSIKISAPITTYDTEDSYPTHLAKLGKGGHRTVETIEERNQISDDRRELGMTVFVNEDKTLYTLKDGLTNKDWVNFSVLLSGLDMADIYISDTEPENPTSETVWINLSDRGIYVRDPYNMTWISLISYEVDGGDF